METARETFLMLQEMVKLQREQADLAQMNNWLLSVVVSELHSADKGFINRLQARIQGHLYAEADLMEMRHLMACKKWLKTAL